MAKLAWDSSFRRAFKRCTRRDPVLKDRIFEVLELLADNPFHPTLRTHKLSGQLEGLWACWVTYDCRIVFALEPDPSDREFWIVLVDLGSHDEVY